MADIPKEPVDPIAHVQSERAHANALYFVLNPYRPEFYANLPKRFRTLGLTAGKAPQPHEMQRELTALAGWLDDMQDCMQDRKDAEGYVPHGYEAAFFEQLAELRKTVGLKAKQAGAGAEYKDIFPITMKFPMKAGGHEHTLPEDMPHELGLLQDTLNYWRHYPAETETSGPVPDRLIKNFCQQMELGARDLDQYKRVELESHYLLESQLPEGTSEDAATAGSQRWLDRIAKQQGPDGPYKS